VDAFPHAADTFPEGVYPRPTSPTPSRKRANVLILSILNFSACSVTTEIQGDLVGFYLVEGRISPCLLTQTLSYIGQSAVAADSGGTSILTTVGSMKAMLPANPIVLFESNHTSTNLKRGKSLLSRTAGRTSSGSAVTSNSSDLAESDNSGLRPKDMTPDCLRAMTVPSLPADFLQLRVGAPLLLMGNLDPQHGLCNGTTGRP
jgi:hypothetical protein